MGPLHEAVTWYKICSAGWQATRWDIQNKENSRLAGGNRFVLEAVAFFCHPAWRIFYHVTVSRKEPIGASKRSRVLFRTQDISLFFKRHTSNTVIMHHDHILLRGRGDKLVIWLPQKTLFTLPAIVS